MSLFKTKYSIFAGNTKRGWGKEFNNSFIPYKLNMLKD